MDQILNTIHQTIAVIVAIIAVLLIDVPLKVLLCLFFIVLGLVCSIFYPITKRLVCPRWMDTAYEYATTTTKLLAARIYWAWKR